MKYKAELYIITHQRYDNKGQLTGKVERINIPVHSFEVNGGANRKIEVDAIDEISVSSEFEQARVHKNIIFYVPPTKDFLSMRLFEIGRELIRFDITFVISAFLYGKLIKSLRFSTDVAWISPSPSVEGGTLKTPVRYHDIQLLHGQFDPRLKKFVHKAI